MKGVSQEKLEDYSVAAHSVKSMSRYVGAEKARETAKQLEAMADAGDFSGVMAHNETFIKYAQSIVDNVRNWLAENHPE
jgi:chemotaxis protein histidine kinase CheA